MNKLTKIAKNVALAASLAAAGSAMAASDGTLDATSTGTTDVSLEILDRVQISSMEDITIPAYTGSGNLTPATTFCVYRNGGDDYQLTLTADTSAFQLDSVSTGDSIPFSVKADEDTDASDGQAVAYNVATGTPLTGSGAVDCSGSDNAALELTFMETDLQAASSGNDYQATMTVLVEPI